MHLIFLLSGLISLAAHAGPYSLGKVQVGRIRIWNMALSHLPRSQGVLQVAAGDKGQRGYMAQTLSRYNPILELSEDLEPLHELLNDSAESAVLAVNCE